MIIGIIGGGASGMAAAIEASKDSGNRVILFERQARVGRKLQATGNGRCNLTNLHASNIGYHSDEDGFWSYALEKFPPEEILRWFSGLGLFTVSEASGRVYPFSDQANSVVDVLRFALQRGNIELLTGFEVIKAKKCDGGFSVESSYRKVFCDKLIIACGGLAGTKLGGSMSGYKLLRSFGHRVTRLRPTLVQLKSGWGSLPALKGVRANCHVQIIHDGQLFAESSGEIQFTEYGLSGPVIFEISRDVCQTKGEWICKLDLLPHVDEDTLYKALQDRCVTNLLAEDLLTGVVHNRLGRVLVQSCGIHLQKQVSKLSLEELRTVSGAVKCLEIELTEPLGMDSAQVTAGGICTSEFSPRTMESKLVPGLFACGEVLDVDGDCGGYNLQWAWSSGRLAGQQAGRNKL